MMMTIMMTMMMIMMTMMMIMITLSKGGFAS